RLFLARRDQHREQAEQQRHQRDQRSELRVEEKARDAAGDSHVRSANTVNVVKTSLPSFSAGSRLAAERINAMPEAQHAARGSVLRQARVWRAKPDQRGAAGNIPPVLR